MIEPGRPWLLLVLGGAAFVLASVAALAGYVAFPISLLAAGLVTIFVWPPSGGIRPPHYAALALLFAFAAWASLWLTQSWTH